MSVKLQFYLKIPSCSFITIGHQDFSDLDHLLNVEFVLKDLYC